MVEICQPVSTQRQTGTIFMIVSVKNSVSLYCIITHAQLLVFLLRWWSYIHSFIVYEQDNSTVTVMDIDQTW